MMKPIPRQGMYARLSVRVLVVCLVLVCIAIGLAGEPEGTRSRGLWTSDNAPVPASADTRWSPTGSLAGARVQHTATLLANGKVLVAGGIGDATYRKIAELYDPASGTWTNTGSLATARTLHAATLLQSGEALVVGGYGMTGYVTSAEIYDPVAGSWRNTGGLRIGRTNFTATLLPNGKVLAAGGYDNNGIELTSAEVYDPATGLWSDTGSLSTGRWNHAAALLPNGKVLVVGGAGPNGLARNAEVYDPAKGSWSDAGFTDDRYACTATLLSNGKVLVAGGNGGAGPTASAALYDPASGSWTNTGSLAVPRYFHTATSLSSGKVLVAGGTGGYGALNSAEIYDPATGTWGDAGSLVTERKLHTATLLQNGKVLVAGGTRSDNIGLNSAELYDPTAPAALPTPTPTTTPTPTPTPTATPTITPVPSPTPCLPVLTVLNNADSGAGSLRQAVGDACPDRMINFAESVASPIVLTSGEIVISKDLTIMGPETRNLTISGNHNSRVFTSNPFPSFSDSGVVNISRLTLSEGNGTGGGTELGGAVNIVRGMLSLDRVTLSGNSTNTVGGGIFVNGLASLTLTKSTVSLNTASDSGGGISVSGGAKALISECTIFGNLTQGNPVRSGGGVQNDGTLNIVNSTISGNSVTSPYALNGGGVQQDGGTATITSTTITNNSASGTGGASGIANRIGVASIRNVIIAGNVNPGTVPDVAGSGFRSLGFNLIGNVGTVPTFLSPTDRLGRPGSPISPLLGSLQDNGGPTLTHALLNGSPAIDAGDASGVSTDQRGQPRPFDQGGIPNISDGTDIGAFEVTPTARVNSTTTIVSHDPDPSLLGRSYSVRVAVAGASEFPGAVPTGFVTVSDGVGGVCTAGLSAPSCSLTSSAVGQLTLTATYSGDAVYNPSSGQTVHTVVLPLPTPTPPSTPTPTPTATPTPTPTTTSTPTPTPTPTLTPTPFPTLTPTPTPTPTPTVTPSPIPTPTPVDCFVAPGCEGDINRDPNAPTTPRGGDGRLDGDDITWYDLFANGVRCPATGAAWPMNEFQRMDVAPMPGGDGALGTDRNQIESYISSGQRVAASGPSAPQTALCAAKPGDDVRVDPGRVGPDVIRLLQIGSQMAFDSDIAVPIDAQLGGGEVIVQFTVHFEPDLVSVSDAAGDANPDVVRGEDLPVDSRVLVNTSHIADGDLGVIVNFNGSGSHPANTASAGTRRLTTLHFHRSADGKRAPIALFTFSDNVFETRMSDALARPLPVAGLVGGSVLLLGTVDGPSAAP